MNHKVDPSAEYKSFLETATSIEETVAIRNVREKIQTQLVRSPKRLGLIYVASSLVGYLASLFICAQNEFGLSNLAQKTAASLCALSQPWCWVACGAIFSLLPFFICALVLGKFQHRYLLFKMWWLVGVVPAIAAATMIFVPNVFRILGFAGDGGMMAMSSFESITAWLTSALIAPYIFEYLCYVILRQKTYQENPQEVIKGL